MTAPTFTEEQLARLEAEPSAAAVTELARAVREQQRTIDSLRLKMDVALRDRDELRSALRGCQEDLRRVRGG